MTTSACYVRLSLGGLPFQIIRRRRGFMEAPVSPNDVLLQPAHVELVVGPCE
jgi:hypothetical protein